ncbi:MAG: hypothetical protein QOJ86_5009 [Bradyrhizobium sp.]|jgi:hypothetical protein|nr:hypothetical protein [Bradyrhizobium sp.]
MTRDVVIVDGRALSWKRICELRRAQLEARRLAEGQQPALFPLVDDCRPPSQANASGRYSEPSLFDLVHSKVT